MSELKPYWKLSSITIPLSSDLKKLATGSQKIADKASKAVNTAVVVLDTAKALYSAFSNPFAAIMTSIIDQISNFLNDLFGTGVYMLVVNPYGMENNFLSKPAVFKKIVDQPDQAISESTGLGRIEARSLVNNPLYDSFGFPKLTPTEAIRYAKESFYDDGDENRPLFSEGANTVALGFLLTAPNLDMLEELMDLLNGVFSIPDFEFVSTKIKRVKSDKVASTVPDWSSLKLNSIQQLADIQDTLEEYLQLARGYLEPKNTVIEDLIDALVNKITQLEEVISGINDLVQRFKNALDATGVWVYQYDGLGGSEEIINTLDDPALEALDDNKYTVFALFVGGGPSAAPIKAVKDLIVKAAAVAGFGLDEIKIIKFSATPDKGSWYIKFKDKNKPSGDPDEYQYTQELPYNCTASVLEGALINLSSIRSVKVQGDMTTGFTVRFIDLDGKQTQPSFLFNDAGVDEARRVVFSKVPDDGGYKLSWNGQQTDTILFNDNASVVESKINSKFPAENETQRLSFQSTPTSGSFKIKSGSNFSTVLPHNCSSLDVKLALESMPHIDSVTVVGDITSGFVISYDGPLVKEKDMPDLYITDNTLLPITVITTTTTRQGRPPVSDIKVSGDTTTGFTFTFTGYWGKKPQSEISVGENNLTSAGLAVSISTGLVTKGRQPSNTLTTVGEQVTITEEIKQKGKTPV